MTESIEAKAARLVVEGRVTNWDRSRRGAITAAVLGDSGVEHRVVIDQDPFCTCMARAPCSHIYATLLATAERKRNPIMDAPQTIDLDPETGEIIEPLTPAVIDRALQPLTDAPITYRTLEAIADTEFVPAALRGRPEAVLAAVLYGRELGLGPMEALAHIDVIDGRPSPSAELLVRLVRSRGHTIELVALTDAGCTVRGVRADTSEQLEATFTFDDARRITTRGRGETVRLADTKRYREYPQDMLWARAVSRLCRRLFADVIAGQQKVSGGNS